MSVASRITLYENKAGKFKIRIDHFGRVATNAWRANAQDAYRDAEVKLVYKPGYVQSVPREKR